MTLGRLAVRLQRLDKKLTKKASAEAARFALAIVNELTHTTPADTSEALSNWIVTLTRPSTKLLPPYVSGEDGSTAEASAKATVAAARLVLRSKQPGHSIFITNNVAHLKYLNEGSSEKAPSGFIERAFLKVRATFKMTKLDD